jgi:arginase
MLVGAQPDDSGHQKVRMGTGPQKIVQAGLETELTNAGHKVQLSSIQIENQFQTENSIAFAAMRLLAKQVRHAQTSGKFPLVLAGNCNTCVGTIAGAGTKKTGVIWFDAHCDFNTPETTQSGFLDGMGVAMLAGKCWRRMLAQVHGFEPVAESNILLIGARDIDAPEITLLQNSRIRSAPSAQIRIKGVEESIRPLLTTMADAVDGVYVHIDLDVLDPAVAPANHFWTPGGLHPDEVLSVIRAVKQRFRIDAAAITAYEPGVDQKGVTAQAALQIAKALVAEEK